MSIKEYSEQEITDAYSRLIWAQGLVDFVLRAGFDLRPGHEGETDGSLTAIFSILRDYLEPAESVMSYLDTGYTVEIKHEEKKESEA
jgi:hypothetical protein